MIISSRERTRPAPGPSFSIYGARPPLHPMGNKQNVAAVPPPTRAYSTTTAPSSIALGKSSQQGTAATNSHHRINRRRSEFQHSRKAQNSDTAQNGGVGVETHTLTPVDRSAVSNNPNGAAVEAAAWERMRQNRRRWSSIATVNPRGGNASTQVIKPKRMAPRQCHLVIKSWSRRSPKCRVVKDIFAAIFMEAEELKAAFGIETSSMGKRLRTDTNFVAHTNMFADTLDFVIRNLDDLSLVTENAEQLGRRHASFPLENGFRPEYWNIFTECIADGVSAGEEDKETQIAWRQLVQTIVYYMKLGYDRETLRLTRHSSFRRSNSPMPTARGTTTAAGLQQERLSPGPCPAVESSNQQQQANGQARMAAANWRRTNLSNYH